MLATASALTRASEIVHTSTGAFACAGVVLRTPLLPFGKILLSGFSGTPVPSDAADAYLRERIAAERFSLRESIRTALNDLGVTEALYLASPDLMSAVDRWLTTPAREGSDRVELALLRYLIRIECRATPFGLFAGCTVGTIGNETELTLAARKDFSRKTRLDSGLLANACDLLNGDHSVRRFLAYRANESIVRSSRRFHLVEARLEGAVRSYQLVSVQRSDYLDRLVDFARTWKSFEELEELLRREEADPSEVEIFLHECIDAQLLLPQLSPTITGPDGLKPILDRLDMTGGPLLTGLSEAMDALETIDELGIGVPVSRYRSIEQRLVQLGLSVIPSRMVQVDLTKTGSTVQVGRHVIREALRGVEVLRRISSSKDALHTFKQAFIARYDRCEVPLIEALDPEIGIGLLIGTDEALMRSNRMHEERRVSHLARRLREMAFDGTTMLVLDEHDVDALSGERPSILPDAFYILMTLAASDSEAVAQGEFSLLLTSMGGPSGATLLGRFCQSDSALEELVLRHLRDEEALRPHAVFAEVVHLPEGRVGNVISRPALRQYEIPYLGRSGVPENAQLAASDLMVSVVENRIVLRSRRMGTEIVPRLTTAHNFGHGSNVPFYRFLGLLQGEGCAMGLSWNWGALDDQPWLPRVVYGRTVLARAQWKVESQEIRSFRTKDDVKRYRDFTQWRNQRKLPSWLMIVRGDNQLALNLESITCIDLFLQIASAQPVTKVVELFPGPSELCVTGPDGSYCNEIIVPIVKKNAAQPSPTVIAQSTRGLSQRDRFTPGDEWVYAKLYCGPGGADAVLADFLHPFARRMLSARISDRWFFVRFADPEPHIRFRMHSEIKSMHQKLLLALCDLGSRLVHEGIIWRFQLDTYEREIERYGGVAGVSSAESLFHIDSEMAAEVIAMTAGDSNLTIRRRMALRVIDRMLVDAGLDESARLQWYRRHGRPSYDARAEYRMLRKEIEEVLSPTESLEGDMKALALIIDARTAQSAPLFDTLNRRSALEKTELQTESLLHSFAHMSVNRLLRSNQPREEHHAYGVLQLHYDGMIARSLRI